MMMPGERWQLRAAFNVVGEYPENDQRMHALVDQFHKVFTAEFIDRASIEFVCERIDPPAGSPPEPKAEAAP